MTGGLETASRLHFVGVDSEQPPAYPIARFGGSQSHIIDVKPSRRTHLQGRIVPGAIIPFLTVYGPTDYSAPFLVGVGASVPA